MQFYVEATGHNTLVTQVFDKESKYLDDDAVFAVKVGFFRFLISFGTLDRSLILYTFGEQDKLIIDFVPVKAPLPEGGEFDEEVQFEVEYNIMLASDTEGMDSSSQQV